MTEEKLSFGFFCKTNHTEGLPRKKKHIEGGRQILSIQGTSQVVKLLIEKKSTTDHRFWPFSQPQSIRFERIGHCCWSNKYIYINPNKCETRWHNVSKAIYIDLFSFKTIYWCDKEISVDGEKLHDLSLVDDIVLIKDGLGELREM